MKRITMLAVLVAIVLLAGFTGCQFLLEQKAGTGGVTFFLGLGAKTIQPPDASITIAKYAVSGTGPSGAVFAETLYTGSSFTISNLVAGAWTLTISGRNAAGIEIGTGIANLTILSGSTVTANVTLAPLSGEGVNGSFTFSASWTSPLVVTGISGTITASGGAAEPFTASISGSSASYSLPVLAAGSYLLSLTATESGGEKFKAIYALRVYKGFTSPLTIAFTMADFLGTTLPTYTVNYIGDGNTGGTVPVDENEYLEGASVTVLGNTGSLEKTDYTFDGWNTELGGTGTSYAAGSTFTMGLSGAELYAKWKYSRKHVVKGILKGDDLTWTKANSPYQIEGHILVETGKTLTIEPGVEVRFNGDYYIRVDGCIKARGTADSNIIVTVGPDYTVPDDASVDNQIGLRLTSLSVPLVVDGIKYVSGNILEYCKFSYTNGIADVGSVFIKNCIFNSTNRYIFSGYNYNGSSSSMVINCDIYSKYIYFCGYYYYPTNIINCKINNGVNLGLIGAVVVNCDILNIGSIIFPYYGWRSVVNNCIIENITNSIIYGYQDDILSNNNILGISSKYYIQTIRGYGIRNIAANYWGNDKIDELKKAQPDSDISFLYDYYDDFNYIRLNYSDWRSDPWEEAGYRGDKLVYFTFSVAQKAMGSTYVDIAIQLQTERPLSRIRWGQTATELLAAAWVPYTAGLSVPFDPSKAEGGQIKMFCQVEDTEGNRSGAFTANFGYTP
jgi:hypothetical protein